MDEEARKALRKAVEAAKEEIRPRTRRIKMDEDGHVKSGMPHFTVTTAGGITGGVVSPGKFSSGAVVKRLTTISVYVDNGNVYEYEVNSEAKAREHAASIVATGYRSVSADSPTILTWFPPSRILKVVMTLPEPSSTKYFDRIKST